MRLLLLVGLSFYWPLLTSCKLAVKAYALDEYGATVYVLVYFAAVTVLGMAITAAHRSFDRRSVSLGSPCLVIGACASLAMLPGVFLPATPAIGILLVAPSVFLGAASFALCAVGWGTVVLSPAYANCRKSLSFDIAVTFLLGYALPIFILDYAPELDASLIPETVRALSPLATCLCLFLALRDCPHPSEAKLAGDSDDATKQSLAPLFAIAAFVLVCSALIGVFSRTVEINELREGYEQRHVFTVVFALLFIASTWAASKWPQLRMAVWGAALLLVVTGMFLAVAYGESLLVAGIDILVVGRLLIWTLYWMLLVEVAKREHCGLAQLIGAFFVTARGISCILTDMLHYILPSEPVSAIGSSAFMVCAEVALLACSLVIIGLTTATDPKTQAGFGDSSPTHDDEGTKRRRACMLLAEANELTERETTILEYLSMGYTMQRIAEVQYVSQNTVRSHVKGLYRKLDCHSKQEVIELVIRRMRNDE